MTFPRLPLPRRAHLLLALGLNATGAFAGTLPIGFSPPEIYLADFGTRALRTGDFNGDGRPDLILINNERGRLDIYL
ncbi:MAG: FG-GAP repeat protein, partial [Kiritimatiellae bacterium]|nr:FG-GAP repeat protein [Kiritimatiellia bacterium]